MRDGTHAGGDSQSDAGVQAPAVRILLVASVRLYREGLARELAGQPSMALVGLASDFESARACLLESQPDVLLLDVRTPRAYELVRAAHEERAGTRVVAFALDENEQDIALCAEAGVTAFATRDITVDGLVNAIAAAARGELACSPRAAAMLFRRVGVLSQVERQLQSERSVLSALTLREKDIASLLASGKSNKEIARTLVIEVATVKNHVHNILAKLHVATRAEAAAHMRARGVDRP